MDRPWKDTDEALGCLLWVLLAALVMFLLSHGGELAERVLHG